MAQKTKEERAAIDEKRARLGGDFAGIMESVPVIGDAIKALRGQAKDSKGLMKKSKRQQILDEL